MNPVNTGFILRAVKLLWSVYGLACIYMYIYDFSSSKFAHKCSHLNTGNNEEFKG